MPESDATHNDPDAASNDDGKAVSTSSQLGDRLASASGLLTGFAFVLSVATIFFMVWFRQALIEQSEVGAPSAEAASHLDASVNRSIAALRGWIAYGDSQFLLERREQWRRIDASQAELTQLSGTRNDVGFQRRVDKLGAALRSLRRIQWAIEDVAQTPGNQPARRTHRDIAKPVLVSTREALRQLIVSLGLRTAEPPVDARTRAALATRLRDQLAAADESLVAYVMDGSTVALSEYHDQIKGVVGLATRLTKASKGDSTTEQTQLLEFALAEIGAYQLLAEDVVGLRQKPDWNVARHLFVRRAGPLTAEVTKLSGELSQSQSASVRRSTALFTLLSLIVVGAALLMAMVSATSIFVSLRLRYRMRSAMDQVKTLGQYRLARKLGQGGMGQVFLARHAMLRRPTAIKLLHPAISRNKAAVDRFRKEVQTTSRLTHPNTIAIFDYGRTPAGVFYYAMEYLHGANLQDVVAATGPLSAARTIHILRQSAASLTEAHAEGLLHRDVKPANVMLCCRGGVEDTVKVLDFGLARDLADTAADGISGGIIGTPHYLAPEAILDADGALPQSDIYALGATGFFLLTGKQVFEGDTLFEVLGRHLSEAPVRPSELVSHPIAADLEDLILACLEKDPQLRPQTAADVVARLSRLVDCDAWSAKDAQDWWLQHREVVVAYRDSGADSATDDLSRLDIHMGDTRVANSSMGA
jgi:serine/threonine protein kinase